MTNRSLDLIRNEKVFEAGPVTVEQVINETLSAGDFVILERNDQTEHRQEAEQNIPDGGRQRHDGQLRVILGPASFFLFAWFTQDFFASFSRLLGLIT